MEVAISSAQLSDLDSSSGSDSDEPKIEWLATGRQRRATAGNRMKSMLANEEEPDSDLELLFAEQGDDQGFSDADAHASDDQMDSSSDEEDNNNSNQADDLEGEKELERIAKEKRAAARKRKANEAIPVKFRKRVRIDTASTSTSATTTARPKKKSERASWLPAVADMPTRASSRKTTRMSKEQLHQQMQEREKRRLKQLAQMQKKQAKLEAMKKPPMTQEDRLREAAIVEERNSKSLNRWEAAEKQREEERLAKLAALNNRTLKGPVITFWSGVGRVGDGWLKNEGYHFMIEEKPKRKPKAPKDKDGKGKAADGKDGVEQKDEQKDEQTGDVQVKKEDGGVATMESAESTTAQATTTNGAGTEKDVAKTNGDAVTTEPATQQDSQAVPVEPATEPMAIDGPEIETQAPVEESVKQPAGEVTADENKDAKMQASDETAAEQPAESDPKTVEATSDPITADAKPEATDETTVDNDAKTPAEDTADKMDVDAPEAAAPGSADENVERIQDTAAAEDSAAATPAAKDSMDKTTEEPAEEPTEEPLKPEEAPKSDEPKSAGNTKTDAPTAQATPNADTPSAPTAPPEGDESLPASKLVSQLPSEAATPQPDAPPADTSSNEKTTRNAIMFQNFHEPAIRDKSTQTILLFGRKMSKLPKQPPTAMCGITNTPARYRDPATKIPFATSAAYAELQRLQNSEYLWSGLLGCWVGSGAYAATGVPERFLKTARCPTEEEVERVARKKEENEKRRAEEAEKKKIEDAERKKKAAADKRAKAKEAKAKPVEQEVEPAAAAPVEGEEKPPVVPVEAAV